MLKILYICTHNCCRSILSEVISNHDAKGYLECRSAGSHPFGKVHPLTLQYLQEAGYSINGVCSQSWDEFESFSPDIVITVCDSAAHGSCPVWFGKALQLHWELADPSLVEGTDEQKGWAFKSTISLIQKRVNWLAERSHLPLSTLLKEISQVGAVLKHQHALVDFSNIDGGL